MDPAETGPSLLHATLIDLERHLVAQRWDEAAKAGEILTQVCDAYRSQGIVLAPEAVQRAKDMFDRCTTIVLKWGESLNQDAHSAGSSNRAVHTYARLESQVPQPSDDYAFANEPAGADNETTDSS